MEADASVWRAEAASMALTSELALASATSKGVSSRGGDMGAGAYTRPLFSST